MTTNTTQAAAMTQADAIHILRLALVQAECAIKGREHTGFITRALVATENVAAPAAPAHAQPSTWEAAALPRCVGVGRDAESPGGKSVSVAFEREPSDDELRTLHNMLATTRTAGSATPVAARSTVTGVVEPGGFNPVAETAACIKWAEVFYRHADGFEANELEVAEAAWLERGRRAVIATPTAPVAEAGKAVDALRNIRDTAYFDSTANGAMYYAKAENALAAIEARDAEPKPEGAPVAEGVDTAELRELTFAYGNALQHEPIPQTSEAWGNLIDYLAAQFAQQREAGRREKRAELDVVFDAFGIGSEARTGEVLMANLRHTLHFANLLHAVEREFFMVPAEPDEDFPDENPGEECLLNSWGSTAEEYIAQFRAALATLATQPAEGLTEQHRQKAARWDYMMLVADNNDGPEAQEMARICDELPDEDGRPESEQLAEVVDRAILAQQAKKGSDHA